MLVTLKEFAKTTKTLNLNDMSMYKAKGLPMDGDKVDDAVAKAWIKDFEKKRKEEIGEYNSSVKTRQVNRATAKKVKKQL